ncbi:hypothetical protein MCUN1_003217 [Malassezia cuniculi]|uniref:Protein-serine/threonine kinase n=1 Tax=Malassezia cuniculi TaxID=948313 RepID=A0AAF0F145_9BASI|nr:hypothetical protein MCUN1_003217 [Malassezia cuniculi]
MHPTIVRATKYAIFGVPIRTMVHALEKTPTPLTLRQLLDNGGSPGSPPSLEGLLASAAFTQRELPIRLARRVRQFYSLPFLVASNPYIQRIARLYASSFARLDNVPPIETPEQNDEFVRILQQLVIDHSDNAEVLSMGFAECGAYMDAEQIGSFLNAALHSRIGIRIIAEQHLALTASATGDESRYRQTPTSVGIVETQMRLADVIRASGEYVRNLCEATFDYAPALELQGDVDVTAVGVPGHLEYVMTELLKNSFRATTERHLKEAARNGIPPVTVTISSTPSDICLRIRDQGGGIEAENMARIFDYAYTTAKSEPVDTSGDPMDVTSGALQGTMGTLAGLGHGLPMSRLYVGYFSPDNTVDVVSLLGHGCDTFVRIERHIEMSNVAI